MKTLTEVKNKQIQLSKKKEDLGNYDGMESDRTLIHFLNTCIPVLEICDTEEKLKQKKQELENRIDELMKGLSEFQKNHFTRSHHGNDPVKYYEKVKRIPDIRKQIDRINYLLS